MSDTAEILHRHKLRKTLGRELVLLTLLEQSTALSHGELNEILGDRLNRASLYRVLQSFEESGLVHKVPDDEVSVKFAFCGHQCRPGAHRDEHLHFKCDQCGETRCLEETGFPEVSLPPNLKMNRTSILVNGLCESCQ